MAITKYKFKANQTFFIRSGWLYKGIVNIKQNPLLFSEEFPQDLLGVGKNMATAIKYWLNVIGLSESKIQQGLRTQELTSLGKLIYKYDTHFEDFGTLCLLHYNLATNQENATLWYFMFQECDYLSFNREISTPEIMQFCNNKPAKSSIESDFDCFIKTYVKTREYEKDSDFENNKFCPFERLELIKEDPNIQDSYVKKCVDLKKIPSLIAYYLLTKNLEDYSEVNISAFFKENSSFVKAFNLEYKDLLMLLSKLEKEKLVRLSRTANTDCVTFLYKEDALANYYQDKKESF